MGQEQSDIEGMPTETRDRRRSFPLGSCSRPATRLAALTVCALACLLASSASAGAVTAKPAWEVISNHAPTNVPITPSRNEVWNLEVSGEGGSPNVGRFRIEFPNPANGKEERTKPISWAASDAELQAELELLKAIGPGNVVVTGGPQHHGEERWTYVITFVNELAGHQIPRFEETIIVAEFEAKGAEIKEVEAKGETPIEGTAAEEASVAVLGERDTIHYKVIPTNVGGAPTVGEVIKPKKPVTVTDKLPPGVTTLGTPEAPGWKCKPEGEGQTEFKCTTEAVVPADGQPPVISFQAALDTGSVTEGSKLTNVVTISGGGADNEATAEDTAEVSSTPAPFGVHGFTAKSTDAEGKLDTIAGDHPYAATTNFFFNSQLRSRGEAEPAETVLLGTPKDANVSLPPGFIGNPLTTKRCTQAEFLQGTVGGPHPGASCPPESQVGSAAIHLNLFDNPTPNKAAVYNLVPPPGVPAEFGFLILAKVPVRIDARVVREPDQPGKEGKYKVTVISPNINEAFDIFGITLSLWGIPAEPSHNAERFKNLNEHERGAEDPEPEKPFLTNPADCVAQQSEPPVTTLALDSWERPGAVDADGNPVLSDPNWSQVAAESPKVTGCDALKFEPTASFGPTPGSGSLQVDEPSGYSFDLTIPQQETVGTLGTPPLKDTTVTLPPGVTISSSAANGLAACSADEIGLQSTQRGNCPLASLAGELSIKTPLLEQPLTGRVYIGKPLCSPCGPTDAVDGKLFRLFIEAEGSGTRVKLPGTASVNQETGQITSTFKENPQLPFDHLTLSLKSGPRAALANPQYCAPLTSVTELTPWSLAGEGIPGDMAVTLKSEGGEATFDGAGAPCPAKFPFNPSFQAGTANSTAGAYSPFNVTFTRQDREETLSKITVQTPPGLLGKIAGVPRCTEQQVNQLENDVNACPAGSRIATASSAAGPGPSPFVVSGPVYLTNGYKGAAFPGAPEGPFGLAIAVPAVAGPFNLGVVVVKSVIQVDKLTGAITITSQELPTSRDGVPFRIQKVSVTVDKPGFMFNPTNCEAKEVNASIGAAPVKAGEEAGAVQARAPFTASSCASLSFNPSLTAATSGKATKANGTSFLVKVEQRPGESNIRKVELQIPKSLPSRLTTLQKACSDKQFAINPAGCPEGSAIGTAKAITPLLSSPLEGPAYLVSHANAAFPDVVFLLQGEGVHVELVGNTDIKNGITYSRFETVPDAPIRSFETFFPSGPASVLGAFGNLCEQTLTIPTKIVGQNGMLLQRQTPVAVNGCPPTFSITKVRVKGKALLVTVKTSQTGTVKISGSAVKTTVKRGVRAGSHVIQVPLSRRGISLKRHHKKLSLAGSLAVGRETASKNASVKT
jgi:hypothetical protein